MIFFDVETLGTDSNSVVLSIGAIRIKSAESIKHPLDLMKDSFFVKLQVQPQVKEMKRAVDNDTLTWWGKQIDAVKAVSFTPSPKDLSPSEGISLFHSWVRKEDNYKEDLVWARGSMDQPVYQSLCKQLAIQCALGYNQFRDVRTAVDILYPESNGGYVEVDENLLTGWSEHSWTKHNPVFDCCIDAAMMLFGKQ